MGKSKCLCAVATLVAISSFAWAADAAKAPSQGKHPWTAQPMREGGGPLQFAIVGDRAGGPRPGVFENAIRKLNLLQPAFVMCVGDLIDGYTEDEAELTRQYDEFDRWVNGLDIRFFYVAGNHDIANATMRRFWDSRRGRSYYDFVVDDVLFLCLNTEDAPDVLYSDEQIKYVGDVLRAHPDVRWTFIFQHRPLWACPSPEKEAWAPVEKLLAGRNYTAFGGHHHSYAKQVRNGMSCIKLGTTGGASQLRGAAVGEMDHLTWVTMTDDGPRIALIELDGVHDENLVSDELSDARFIVSEFKCLTCDAVRVDGETFAAGRTKITLTNDSKLPLVAKLGDPASDQMDVRLARHEARVEPGSKEVIDVEFVARSPIDRAALAPIEIPVSLAVEHDEDASLCQTKAKVFFDWTRPCPRSPKPIVVDGALDDWTTAFETCEQPQFIQWDANGWRGPEDASFRFAVSYDDDYLYVAAESRDDQWVCDAEKPPWRQDGFYVFLDVRDDPERSQNTGDWDRRFEDFLMVIGSPGDGSAGPKFEEQDRLPDGLKKACVRTKSGCVLELAVPIGYVNARQAQPWQAVRLNIGACDYDPDEGQTVLWWRPRWGAPNSYDGSGTFVRE